MGAIFVVVRRVHGDALPDIGQVVVRSGLIHSLRLYDARWITTSDSATDREHTAAKERTVALFAVSLVAVALGIALAVLVLRRFWLARSETHGFATCSRATCRRSSVDEILTRKDVRIFEGREGYATVLYCRIWNFGHFAETLSPDETLRYLNEFYTLAGKSIQKHRGMIDKFLGDGIMGVFGMPLDDPFKEEHAIRAALDIIRLVAGMDARWIAQGRQPLRVGIGINSGNMTDRFLASRTIRVFGTTCRPAVTDIMDARERACTVEMISSMSMPCSSTPVVPRFGTRAGRCAGSGAPPCEHKPIAQFAPPLR